MMRSSYLNSKCYKRFIKHVIGAADAIGYLGPIYYKDLDIFENINESGTFNIEYSYHNNKGTLITFCVNSIVVHVDSRPPYSSMSPIGEECINEVIQLKLVDKKGVHSERFSKDEWNLVCQYIRKELCNIREKHKIFHGIDKKKMAD